MLELPPPHFGLIGHRGAQDCYPENTLASCKAAAEIGLTWIEVDLQLSACGHWIVLHDPTLDRTTDATGLVANYTLPALTSIRIAGIHPLPRVEDLLALLKAYPQVVLNLELKLTVEQHPMALSALERLLSSWPLESPPYFSSFEHAILDKIRARWPKVALGYLVDQPVASVVEKVCAMPNTSLNCHAMALSPEIAHALSEKVSLLAYTVNDPSFALALLEAGVFGVFTDEPKMLITSLASWR